MEADQYLLALRDRSAALLAAARTDVAAPIPSCPGWTMADLVSHVGGLWGWAAAIVRTGARADPPAPPEGTGGAELIEWAEGQAHLAFEVLAEADPDTDCWTFGLPRSRLFWFRRQALEVAVHVWDAQRAIAHPEPIDAALAVDGIDEFLDMMLPRVMGRQPDSWSGQTFHLHCTDGEGEWLVRLGPGTEVSTERTHAKGDVALRGSASSLYLWSVNRLPTADLDLIGDRAVADRWSSEITF
jgi:uncharacterized protein (TIGR03083 family)